MKPCLVSDETLYHRNHGAATRLVDAGKWATVNFPAMNPPASRRRFFSAAFSSGAALAFGGNAAPFQLPRCSVTPEPPHQAAFALGGRESTRWHFGADYPRPFFYPFYGPSGVSLTRMGHPGAPNHDHHQSIWFAHQDVSGTTFWANQKNGVIRQKEWLCYDDGDEQALMAVRLSWQGGDPVRELMEQTLVAVNRPAADGGQMLELQSTFAAMKEPVVLGKTNFGFLAVRVAKSVSAFFGGGVLTDSEGRTGEEAIFGQRAMWMDYSGPIAEGATEGITFFDHPENPRSPTHWHVRSDGWMGASFCFSEGFTIAPDQPLRLRYLLHAHPGGVDGERAAAVLADFAKAPRYGIVKSAGPHRQYEAREEAL
jgi:hypothetical protein